ncbi:hypothetical protein L1987_07095 [Smallanthus sonchifolius]|uniref:Uncharacterized protein n=1 Tax=Smallanthus sonchifolius TaxID=185202 RepID=A0ACB9K039_9ASTR|nr:hypothetical protein L1987_07095 [Smallanthus sonchifolius]
MSHECKSPTGSTIIGSGSCESLGDVSDGGDVGDADYGIEKHVAFHETRKPQPLSVEQSSNTEHFPYEICNCKSCLEEADWVEYDEDVPKKKKGSQKSLKKRYEAGDPSVGLLVSSRIAQNLPNQITAAEATLNWQSENNVAQNNSDVESISYDEFSSIHEFEHLFMAEPEHTERVDSDIEDATSRAKAQDQAQGRNVFTNTDSKQQFTFDEIPPSKWR